MTFGTAYATRTVYRIRNAEGFYSTGGVDPTFVERKRAKIWRAIGHVKCHLKQRQCRIEYVNACNLHSPKPPLPVEVPADWIVEACEVVERCVSEKSARELIGGK